jgi:hypothetical protein
VWIPAKTRTARTTKAKREKRLTRTETSSNDFTLDPLPM